MSVLLGWRGRRATLQPCVLLCGVWELLVLLWEAGLVSWCSLLKENRSLLLQAVNYIYFLLQMGNNCDSEQCRHLASEWLLCRARDEPAWHLAWCLLALCPVCRLPFCKERGCCRVAGRLFILNIFRVRKTPCAVLSTQLNHPKCGLAAESKRGEEPLMFSIFFPFPRRLALPWPDVIGSEFSTESAKKHHTK